MTDIDQPEAGNTTKPSNDGRPVETLMNGLRNAGMDEASIAIWVSAVPDPGHTPAKHLSNVLNWDRRFPDSATARMWFDSQILLRDAPAWYRAGFSCRQAEHVQFRVLMSAADPRATVPMQAEKTWRASGLPAAWICACLDAGIVEAATARQLYDART